MGAEVLRRLFAILLAVAAWTLVAPAHAQCPDREALVQQIEQALVEVDFGGVELGLKDLEEAFGCGDLAEPELLARMWLTEAAWLTFDNDRVSAADSWRAASRIVPGAWNESFGTDLREQYDEAVAAAPATGTISINPPLDWYVAAVDGTPVAEVPVTVAAGVHVVQIGPSTDEMLMARIVWVPEGSIGTMSHALNEGPRPVTTQIAAQTAEVEEEVAEGDTLVLYTSLGLSASFGNSNELDPFTEPSAKLILPIETGVVARPGSVWVRGVAMASPMVFGRFVYDDDFGTTATPAALGGHIAAGGITPQADYGGLIGYQWPDRVAIRAVVGRKLQDELPWHLEARLGANVGSNGFEPALGVNFGIVPTLVE